MAMSDPSKKSTLHSFRDEVWNSGDFSNLDSYVASNYEVRNDPGDPWNGKISGHSQAFDQLGFLSQISS